MNPSALLRNLSPAAKEFLQSLQFPQWLPQEFELQEIRETHISIVLIGRKTVYKLKKHVAFGFVSHLDRQDRLRSAQNEVLLNRRLATDVYLGLRFLVREDSTVALTTLFTEASTNPDDYLEPIVIMRRLSEESSLLSQLKQSNTEHLTEALRGVAAKLAEFHRDLYGTEQHTAATATQAFLSAANDNIAFFTAERLLLLSEETRTAFQTMTRAVQPLLLDDARLREREKNGWVVEGHGDLRCGHIYLENDCVTIIDCVEFNRELRVIDALNDIAFLAMDLDLRRRGDLRKILLHEYQNHAHAVVCSTMLRLFCWYRAMVRAKVAFLASEQANAAESPQKFSKTERYLSLACRYSLDPPTPLLILLGGPMGSGKSTLARFLAAHLDANVIRSDALRKELFGKDSADNTLAFMEGKYSTKATETTYCTMNERAAIGLSRNDIVILDATFSKRQQRASAAQQAAALGCRTLFLLCNASEEVLRKRLTKRNAAGKDISDGRSDLLTEHLREFELPAANEPTAFLEIATEQPLDTQLKKALDFLARSTD